MNGHFVQDNVSKSSYGVLRGLHLQKGDMAQAKLVSCQEGRVWDVAVDLREDSPTFGQWLVWSLALKTDCSSTFREALLMDFQC